MWCGRSSHSFRSRGRVLVINYVYQTINENPFTLSYTSESKCNWQIDASDLSTYGIKSKINFMWKLFARLENVLKYKGMVSENQTNQVDTMQSPFFPNFYPRDLIVEHLIECSSNDTSQCHIEITFSDFLIASSSVMEVSVGGFLWLKISQRNINKDGRAFVLQLQFYNEHDQLLARHTGEIFRPPIMYVQARLVRILFYANDGTEAGYSATINYSTKSMTNETTSTHCGGLVESYGGAITMMNMTNSSAATFDCIWLVKPPNSYLHLKTHLLVRIDTFENMGKLYNNINFTIHIPTHFQQYGLVYLSSFCTCSFSFDSLRKLHLVSPFTYINSHWRRLSDKNVQTNVTTNYNWLRWNRKCNSRYIERYDSRRNNIWFTNVKRIQLAVRANNYWESTCDWETISEFCYYAIVRLLYRIQRNIFTRITICNRLHNFQLYG